MQGPIARLADDVLLEIFDQCLPPSHWDLKYSPEEAPVLFLRVCKHWRALAMEHSAFWSRHNIVDRQGISLEHQIQTLGGLLQRAKGAPLSLRMATGTHGTRARAPIAVSALPGPNLVNQLVLPMVGSIARLVLQGAPIRDIHEITRGQLSQLENLVLDFRYSDDADGFDWATAGPVKAFADCTCLRRVLLVDIGELQNVRLPLHHLTHFFQYQSAEAASKFMLQRLHEFQQLRHFYIEMNYPDDICDPSYRLHPWASFPVVTLDSLQTLSISYWSSVNVNIGYPTFFDRVRFPKLQQLRLEGFDLPFGDAEFWTAAHVERFLGVLKGLNHLDTLSLSVNRLDYGFVHALFDATAGITTLDLDFFQDLQTIFQALTVSDSASPATLLPNLHTLIIEMGYSAVVIEGLEEEHIDPDVFSRFLESRMLLPPEHRLRKVVFYSTVERPEQADDARPYIQVVNKFVAEGLMFERILHPNDTNLTWRARDAKLAHWEECCSFL